MLVHPTCHVLGQRYQLSKKIGEGSSSVVFEAVDLLLGRSVAVKCVKRDSALPLDGDRFVSEAQTLARLKHPHIVEIYDAGRDVEGQPYLVMELMQESLARLLAREGALSPEVIIALLLPLCGALAWTHDLGIVHCDLKPENIAVERGRNGSLRGKLLDFGIARINQVPTELVLGTPGYMAPEQILGEAPGAQADVWGLGAVAFRSLTGRLPVEAASSAGLLERVLHERLPSTESCAAHLPKVLALAIDRALERSLDARYATMREFAHALIVAGSQAGIALPRDPDPLGLPEAPQWQTGVAKTTSRLPAERRVPPGRLGKERRRKSVALAAGVASISGVLISIGCAFWLRQPVTSARSVEAPMVREQTALTVTTHVPVADGLAERSSKLLESTSLPVMPIPEVVGNGARNSTIPVPGKPVTKKLPGRSPLAAKRARGITAADQAQAVPPPVHVAPFPARELKRDWDW